MNHWPNTDLFKQLYFICNLLCIVILFVQKMVYVREAAKKVLFLVARTLRGGGGYTVVPLREKKTLFIM